MFFRLSCHILDFFCFTQFTLYLRLLFCFISAVCNFTSLDFVYFILFFVLKFCAAKKISAYVSWLNCLFLVISRVIPLWIAQKGIFFGWHFFWIFIKRHQLFSPFRTSVQTILKFLVVFLIEFVSISFGHSGHLFLSRLLVCNAIFMS